VGFLGSKESDTVAILTAQEAAELLDYESPDTWVVGENEVVITVTNGEAKTVYTVVVTKTDD
jgi:hypothetical protein